MVRSRSRSPGVHVSGWPPTQSLLVDCAAQMQQMEACAACVVSLKSRRAGFCRSCVSGLKIDSVLAVAVALAGPFARQTALPVQKTSAATGTGRGVGYGGTAGDEKRVASIMEQQKSENLLRVHKQMAVFRELVKFMRPLTAEFFAALLYAVVPLIKEALRFSWMDVEDAHVRKALEAALELSASTVAGFADLLTCNFAITRNFQVAQETSVAREMRRVLDCADGLRQCSPRVATRLVGLMETTVEGVLSRAYVPRVRSTRNNVKVQEYEEVMKPLQVRWLDEFASHHFKNASSSLAGISAEKMRRIRSEIMSLSSSLPLHKNAAIFLLLNEARLDLLKVLISGPIDTPYEYGLFEFHVLLPAEYPNRPPLVHLVTTGNNTVRFGPNLYACGKVCLSLLGTWQGPGWMPQQSTLLQLFVTIQSIILVPEPYFLEPGYEAQAKSKASDDYRNTVRKHTLKVAIENVWKRPAEGFEEITKLHFSFHKLAIDTKAKDANLSPVHWHAG